MIETAENLRRKYGVTREAQDSWAERSHRRAVAAIDAGLFADETVTVPVPARRKEPEERSRLTNIRAAM